ncbi:hypothetical protein IMY05_C2502000100 [Salix suchowensis]|nr:hypothetical protein IMY05_C2502000100 [Salix suchowensis]
MPVTLSMEEKKYLLSKSHELKSAMADRKQEDCQHCGSSRKEMDRGLLEKDVQTLDSAAAEYLEANLDVVKANHYFKSDEPFRAWMPYQEEFLAEEIRQKGQGDAVDLAECPSCEDKGRESVDSQSTDVMIALAGSWNVQLVAWSGMVMFLCIALSTHFEKVALKDLGLRIQLGHTNMECVNPEAGTKKFTVIHMNGIHIVNAESVCLWLLSSVATEDQESVCIEGLVEKEECLQEAQCHDALEKICALQQAKSHLITFKWWNISGQRKNTQAQSSLEALDNKIDLNTQHYKDAHNALYASVGLATG